MIRTFDDLSTEEKQKYSIYQKWEHNWTIMFSWYIAILLTVAMIASLAMFTVERAVEANSYAVVCTAYMIYLAYTMMHKTKVMKKERLLIFGIGDSENEYFFGLTKQDLKVKPREVIREVKKMISDTE